MKLLFSLSVLLSLVSSNLAVLSSAGNTTDEEKQNYIVKVTDPQAHRSLSTSSSHEILHVFKHGNLLEMRLDKAEVRELMDSDDVLDIEEDQPVYLSPTYPSSPGDMNADMDASIGENPAEVPYGIQMVQALDVADDKVGSSDITVCIADTGYDILHNDLPQGSKVVGKSFVPGQSWSVDGHGHGTHVAGTIAALEDGLGVLGVVRNGEMNLLIAKVLADTSGYGTWAGILAGVEWCQENGADVINMSLGGGGFSQINSDFFREIHEDDDVLIVAAAGNSGPGQVAYPASYDSVLSVGAIDINKNIASFSQTNDQVELVAPGVAVNSTLPNNSYASWNGTSMACPHVAGVAALIWSHFPHLTATEIRNVLRVTAENLGNDEGKDPVFGYGLVRAKDAFDALHNDDTTPVPPTPTPVPAVPPTPSLTPAGGGGDPHFKTFTGVYFSFHGHCDLVLMHSKIMFESESAGLALHVRTTRVDSPRGVSYSYISGAAVQIGNRVIEVSDDGVLFIDGHTAFENDEETTSFAGYNLKRSIKGTKGHIVVFDLDLLDGKAIEIRSNTKTRMVFVDVEGHFAGSEGLLGAPMGEDNTGLLSRDGSFDMTGNWNTFGEEWQVLDTEPMLFQERRAPQHPAGCVYESSGKQKNLRRRLVDDAATEVTLDVAAEACTKAVGNMKEFCVEDVMATGDLELAEDPFYN